MCGRGIGCKGGERRNDDRVVNESVVWIVCGRQDSGDEAFGLITSDDRDLKCGSVLRNAFVVLEHLSPMAVSLTKADIHKHQPRWGLTPIRSDTQTRLSCPR